MNFYSNITPILILSRTFGFFPFVIKSNKKNRELKLSFFWCLNSCLTFSFIFYLTILLIQLGQFDIILSEVWRSITIVEGVFFIVEFIKFSIFKGYRKILLLISSLKNYDENAIKYGIFIDYAKEKKEYLLCSLSIITIVIYNAILMMLFINRNDSTPYSIQISGCYFSLILYFFAIQFFTFSMVLKTRFDKLNEFLKFSMKIQKQNINMQHIANFMKLYYDLYQIVKHFNETFSSSVLTTLVKIILNLIFTIHGVLNIIYQNHSIVFVYNLSTSSSWILYHFICMIMICHSGNSLTKTAEESEELILAEAFKTGNLIKSNELLHHHNKLKCLDKNIQNTFFVINWKLFFTVRF